MKLTIQDTMKVCKSCGSNMPQKRVELGYSECVKCSDVETYGFVNIINHKTGNTVQPLPRSQAQAINKIGDRKRFGTVLKGGSKSTAYNPKKTKHKVPTAFIGSEFSFDLVGKKALQLLEEKGLDSALSLVDKEVKDYTISALQAVQIRKVLHTFSETKTN